MAFKPANANASSKSFESDNPGGLYPVPKAGSRKARVSLIVDLGIQKREDFEEEDGTKREQKPCQQIAVFADLTADTVDYGGVIGKQHYRLLLNKSFGGNIQGINFVATPPKDAKGNIIKGKPWGWHPANLLSKLAKAVGKPELIEAMDVEQLLNEPFMAQVEVKITDSDKKDSEGNVIQYKNVNYKGCAEVPLDDDDNPLNVAELNQKPRCVTFDTATVDDIQFIRPKLRAMIKLAENYAGSAMQKAIEAFEAKANTKASDDEQEEPEAPQKPAKAAKPKAKPAPVEEDNDEDDSPF